MSEANNIQEMASFWIVGRRIWPRAGTTDSAIEFSPFPHRHTSEGAASREAERLCRKAGGRFYVFECVSVVEKIDIAKKRLNRPADPDPDIPF